VDPEEAQEEPDEMETELITTNAGSKMIH